MDRRDYIKAVTLVFATLLVLILPLRAVAGPFGVGGGDGVPQVKDCFESREGGKLSTVTPGKLDDGTPNVRCSDKTGAVLWYGDAMENTVPVGIGVGASKEGGEVGGEGGDIFVRPRKGSLRYFMPCTRCHGTMVKVPDTPEGYLPREVKGHKDVVADALNFSTKGHGGGTMWCYSCHSAGNRDMLVGNKGGVEVELSFDESHNLCGSCHGGVLKDWRAGIHGKRMGGWATTDKKRWFSCVECHDPHSVAERAFKRLAPEPPPERPKGNSRPAKSH